MDIVVLSLGCGVWRLERGDANKIGCGVRHGLHGGGDDGSSVSDGGGGFIVSFGAGFGPAPKLTINPPPSPLNPCAYSVLTQTNYFCWCEFLFTFKI